MDVSDKNMKINSSSLVSLKAELLRKEQEYLADRQQYKSTWPKPVKKKVKLDGVGAQNAGVAERAAKDLEQKLIEENEAKNSREILEKKAKIYDAMAKGYIQDDDENEDCLVDFQQKKAEHHPPTRTYQAVAPPSGYDDENRLPNSESESRASISIEADSRAPIGPVHYANVQHNEIRTHGVGYFQFAEDIAKRQEQIELLNKLRNQTEEQKAKKERIMEKRKNIMAQRLAKMRQRRGLPEPEPEEEESEKKPEVPEVVPLVRVDTWRDLAPITREWDKGKRKDLNKSYIDSRRDDRPAEFAPPQEFQVTSSSQSKRFTAPAVAKKVNPLEPKTYPAQNYEAKPKRDFESIDKMLKNIRSKTESPGLKPSKISETSIQKTNTSETGTSLTKSGVLNIEQIPLPPLPSSTSEISPLTSQIESAVSVSTYTAAHYDMQSPSLVYGELGKQPPATVTVPVEGTVANSQTQNQGSVPHWRYVDTSQPPPPLPYVHQTPQTIPLVSENVASIGPLMTDSQNTTNADLPVADPTIATSLGGIAQQPAVSDTLEKRTEPSAPQPAHYSSAPSKVQIVRPAYERVHLHQVPLTLPAPPTESNVPQYSAQNAVYIPRERREGKQNKNIMHMWNTQYDYKDKK